MSEGACKVLMPDREGVSSAVVRLGAGEVCRGVSEVLMAA